MLNNLPHQSTEFIGRRETKADIIQYITSTPHRLIALVGMGGVGKTRLAVSVGQYILDNNTIIDQIFFVSLTPIVDDSDIVDTIAEAIGLKLANDKDIQAQLIQQLNKQSTLLILDNFEHVISGRGIVKLWTDCQSCGMMSR